jgi:hypothetical protein
LATPLSSTRAKESFRFLLIMTTLPNNNENNFAPTDITQMNFWNDKILFLPSHKVIEERISKTQKYFLKLKNFYDRWKIRVLKPIHTKKRRYGWAVILDVALILLILVNAIKPAERMIAPFISNSGNEEALAPLTEGKEGYQVFGFAPYWTFNKLDNVDFKTLTTMAYFGVV